MPAVPTAINGKVPEAFLAPLPGVNGDGSPHTADKLAVQSYVRLRQAMQAAGLGDLVPSAGWSCYRSLTAQGLMKTQGLTKLNPGQSIHGEALGFAAVDFKDIVGDRQRWLRTNGPRYGWTQPPWAINGIGSQPPEPWHWEYDSDRDTHPAPAPPEDDMPLTAADLDLIEQRVTKSVVENIIRGGEYIGLLDRVTGESVWSYPITQYAVGGGPGPGPASAWLGDARIAAMDAASDASTHLAPLLSTMPQGDVDRVAGAVADLFSALLGAPKEGKSA